jgi:two-component system, chemotaxis family, CheB/CheR fusion protein
MTNLPDEPDDLIQSMPGFLIVGLGASAGGIEALREFFTYVPADSGIAYVVILHLSPDHESQLANVLQTVTPLPVSQVTESVRVEPNHVYVVSPNQHLTMVDGKLMVSPNTLIEERRAPVDIFFRTLAEMHHNRAVCVVLSGSGADGSMGLKRVKERGGVVFVQNPREAAFNEMPRSAIATDLVDDVLPVAAIPARIMAYKASLGTIAIPLEANQRPEEQQQALREVFTQLRVRTGHDFSNYKRQTLLRRITRRINVRNLPDLPAYAAYIRENLDEVQAMLKDLLISVTNFFRDKEAFAAIEQDILPRIFYGKRADEQVRIWVVGCATGEEAYSIAMLCAERVIGVIDAPAVQIFASDIDEAAIAHAREGLYTLNETADVSPERLRRFFTLEDQRYRIRREIREMVLFANHNILKDPPFSHLDLVTCRNMLIYLNHTAQERVMETLHFALNPGGYLFLGSSESVDGSNDLFSTVNREQHIFQSRSTGARTLPVPDLTPTGRVHAARQMLTVPEPDERIRERLNYDDLHQRLLEEYAPPSLVVNEDYAVIRLSERAGRYLQIAGKELSNNLLQLVRPELRLELRSALYQAVQRQTNIQTDPLSVRIDEHIETVTIRVRPVLRQDDPAQGFLLIVFEQGTAPPGDTEPVMRSDEPIARQLEDEVQRLKQQLRTSSEQYEYQTEELRATNEELYALNEELRSSTEELETSKEELQSINEELRTVNQELKVKVEEVTQHSTNLQNLVNSTNIGTIFLDRGLRVKLFTPAARELFSLIPADYGRSLADITHRLGDVDVLVDAETVLEKLRTIEREVYTTNGRVYLLRVLPYRAGEDRIGGVVITFVEISERKQREANLAFLAEVSQELVRLINIGETMNRVGAKIGAYFDLSHCQFVELDEAQEVGVVNYGWQRTDVPSISRSVQRISDFLSSEFVRRSRTGETIVVRDASADPLTDAKKFAGLGIGSFVSVPYVRNGTWRFWLGLYRSQARDWREDEIDLMRELATRIWTRLERARAEIALRESEERFRTLADTVPQVIWTNDGQGEAIYFNQRWYDYSGLSYTASVGPGWQVIVHPDDALASRKRWHQALNTGTVFDTEYRLRRSDGVYRWFIGRNVPLRDTNGQIVSWFGSATDIEDLKQAQAALRESEERFRLLVEGARDYAMFLLDTENRITFWSAGAERVFGYSEAEALGQRGAIIFTPEDRTAGAVEHELEVAIKHGSALDRRWHIRNDGTRLFVDGAMIRLDDEAGALRGFVKIGRDATAQHEAEEALQRAHDQLESRVQERTAELAAANQLLRQEIVERRQLEEQRALLMERLISAQESERQRIARELHDTLGQFLSALELRLSMVQSLEGMPPRVQDQLAQLSSLIKQIDHEVDRLTIELRPPALDQLGLADAIQSYANEWAATNGVAVDVLVTGLDTTRLPPALETTSYRIVQEALTNVLKHAQASTVSIIVERRPRELRVIVEDNGVGFEPTQGRGDNGGRQMGLLGMAERAALAGGELRIESEPGAGTTIYLLIPL